MDKLGVSLIGALAAGGILVLSVLVTTLGGLVIGWVVGWFFSETILSFLGQLGINHLEMWQIGASLGFIGGFFRSTHA